MDRLSEVLPGGWRSLMVLRSTWSVSVSRVLMQPQDEWLLTDGLGGFAMGTRMVSRVGATTACASPAWRHPCGGEPFSAHAMAEVVAHDEKTPLWQATFAPHGVLSPPMHVPNRTTHEPNCIRTEWTSSTVELVRTLTMKRGTPGACAAALSSLQMPPSGASLAPLVDFHAFDRGQESPQIDLVPSGVLLQRGEVRARFEISGGSFVVAPDHWHTFRRRAAADMTRKKSASRRVMLMPLPTSRAEWTSPST